MGLIDRGVDQVRTRRNRHDLPVRAVIDRPLDRRSRCVRRSCYAIRGLRPRLRRSSRAVIPPSTPALSHVPGGGAGRQGRSRGAARARAAVRARVAPRARAAVRARVAPALEPPRARPMRACGRLAACKLPWRHHPPSAPPDPPPSPDAPLSSLPRTGAAPSEKAAATQVSARRSGHAGSVRLPSRRAVRITRADEK
jgi:hypothetical protein